MRIEYETSPGASALQWLDPPQTSSGKRPFLFTQSQAIHARSWIPTMDSPSVRVTYDAVVRVPAGIRVVMSAAHQTHDLPLGIYRFRMAQPQAVPDGVFSPKAGLILLLSPGHPDQTVSRP